jgi:cobalt-zinc-cadmium efflux system outer membrane protein
MTLSCQSSFLFGQTNKVNGQTIKVNLSDIIQKALQVSPDVKVISASIKAKTAELRTSALGPQSEIGLEIEDFGIDGPDFFDSEMTLSFARDIEPSSLRNRKRQAAESALNKSTAMHTNELLLYVQEVSASYYEVATRQMKLDLSKETESLAKEMLKVAKNRVSAGAAPGLEQERSEMEYDMALIDVKRAEKELHCARVKMASFLDLKEEELPEIDAKNSAPFESTLLHLEQSRGNNEENDGEMHPLVEAARHSIAEAELTTAIINLESKPIFKTSFGFRHTGDTSDNKLIMGFSVPLGSARRNQSKMETASWLLEEEKKNAVATKVKLTRELEQKTLEAIAVSHEFKAIETRILPAAERIFQSVKEGYLRGELQYTDLLVAKQSLVLAAEKRVTALSDLRLALLNLEIARGGSIEMKNAIREVLE